MNGFTLLIGSAVIFLIAYVVYGSWLAKQWGIDPKRKTPAETQKDGIDYLPTKPAVLLGHHFSSIAGAGPIVGPITAAVFGWVPVTLWIIVGSVFFGGVHDYGSLVASLRHKGKSIGQIIEANIGERAKILFAIFAWITLLVVIAAFANIVAATFVANPSAGTSSLLFILLAVAFGLLVYRTGISLFLGTVLGLIGMAAAFYIGHIFPIVLSKDMWLLIMMGYIFVASIAPVWILLQPRDYLNSFLLYLMIIAAFLGICFYQPTMEISPFVGFDLGHGQWLFPVLFVTVACGAISGFHSLVSSGTSSKQLDNEKNAKLIGYGSMLIEGLLAICAIISVAYVAADKLPALLKAGGPVNAFSQGTATFMTALGLDFNLSKEFVALTISAFALTTLDTPSRPLHLPRTGYTSCRKPQRRQGTAHRCFPRQPLRRNGDHDRSGLVHVRRFLPHDLADFRYCKPDACRSVSARYRRMAQKRKQKDIHGHDPDVLHVCRHLLLSWSADLRQPRQELADRRHLRRSGCSVCSSVH